jgi:hypothetical protein
MKLAGSNNYSFITMIIVLGFLLPIEAKCEYKMGIKVGTNFTWPSSIEPNPTFRDYPAGYLLGFLTQADLNNHFSLFFEINIVKEYQLVSYETPPEDDIDYKTRFSYFSILFPTLIKFKPGESIHLNTGLTLGYSVKATYESGWNDRTKNSNNITHELPQFELMYTLGIGTEFHCQKLRWGFDMRYLVGLTTFEYKEYPWNWRNHSIQVSLIIFIDKENK